MAFTASYLTCVIRVSNPQKVTKILTVPQYVVVVISVVFC